MINKYVAMGFGALIALAPVAALAQEQVAQATDGHEHKHGSLDARTYRLA